MFGTEAWRRGAGSGGGAKWYMGSGGLCRETYVVRGSGRVCGKR